MISVLFLALAAGSAVYCALTVIAALRYRGVRPSGVRNGPAVSILKPLAGVDDGLEENLRTFFTQNYAQFEILFAVRESKDPAVQVVEHLCAEYPHIPAHLIFTGEPPYPNAKVFSLDAMLAAARYDLIVMADSDTRVTPDMLSVLVGEFADPQIGLITCPYRAVPGFSLWSTLEALGLNTEFIGGVLMARMMDGMKFAIGPTIAARRDTLAGIGGMDALKEYLAEDFVMGKLAAERGCGVILSSYVIEHRIGAQRMTANFRHRLRWARSTRCSRPHGYVGQLFTHPIPLALLALAAAPAWWPVAAVTAALRFVSAWVAAVPVLGDPVFGDPLFRRFWWLLPVQDMISFAVWIAGFFGNTIVWRGHKYCLLRDGRFELIPPDFGTGLEAQSAPATIVLDEPA